MKLLGGLVGRVVHLAKRLEVVEVAGVVPEPARLHRSELRVAAAPDRVGGVPHLVARRAQVVLRLDLRLVPGGRSAQTHSGGGRPSERWCVGRSWVGPAAGEGARVRKLLESYMLTSERSWVCMERPTPGLAGSASTTSSYSNAARRRGVGGLVEGGGGVCARVRMWPGAESVHGARGGWATAGAGGAYR